MDVWTETTPPDVVIADAARQLAVVVHGPYRDLATAEAGTLTAQAVRYLNYAVRHGGVSDPATVADVTGQLSAAAYRLPQLLGLLGGWLAGEAAVGQVAGGAGRPAEKVADSASAALAEAIGHADALARCLGAAHAAASTLHADGPAAGGRQAPMTPAGRDMGTGGMPVILAGRPSGLA